jgi:hypothetical protein
LAEEGESGRRFLRFLARLQSDRTGIHLELEARNFADIHEGISKMLEEGCPAVPKKAMTRRVTMALDVMLQSLANADVMSSDWTEGHPGEGLVEFANSLKEFLAGGLSAGER